MASPTIRGQTAPAAGLTTTSPAGTAVGDLVIVYTFERLGAGSATTLTVHSSMDRQLVSFFHNDGSTDGSLGVAVKIATAAGATSYQGFTSSVGTETWTGCSVLTVGTFDPTLANIRTGTALSDTSTAAPNPPSVTLDATRDWLVFAVSAWHLASSLTNTATAPTNYTNLVQVAGAATADLGISSRALTAPASEDPGAYTDDQTPNGTCSFTFGVSGFIIEVGAIQSRYDFANRHWAWWDPTKWSVFELTAESELDLSIPLTVADATHGHTSENVVLSQVGAYVPSKKDLLSTLSRWWNPGWTLFDLTSESELDLASTLVVDNATHSHTAQSPTLQVDAFVPELSASLKVVYQYWVPSYGFIQLKRAVFIAETPNLVIQDATHSQTTDNLVLVTKDVAIRPRNLANVIRSWFSDALPQVQVPLRRQQLGLETPTLAIQDTVHAQATTSPEVAENPIARPKSGSTFGLIYRSWLTEPQPRQRRIIATPSGLLTLVIDSATHDHTTDNLTLVQNQTYTPKPKDSLSFIYRTWLPERLVQQRRPVFTVAGDFTLAIDSATHAHSTDNLVLTEIQTYIPKSEGVYNVIYRAWITDPSVRQSRNRLVTVQAVSLVIQDAIHAQTADSADVTTANTLLVRNKSYLQVIRAWYAARDYTVFSLNSTGATRSVTDLVIQDATHGQITDSLTFSADAPPVRTRTQLHAIIRQWNPGFNVIRVRTKEGSEQVGDFVPKQRDYLSRILRSWVRDYPIVTREPVQLQTGITTLVINPATHDHTADDVGIAGQVDNPPIRKGNQLAQVLGAWYPATIVAHIRYNSGQSVEAVIPDKRTLIEVIANIWQPKWLRPQTQLKLTPPSGATSLVIQDATHTQTTDSLTLVAQGLKKRIQLEGVLATWQPKWFAPPTRAKATPPSGELVLVINDALHTQTTDNLILVTDAVQPPVRRDLTRILLSWIPKWIQPQQNDKFVFVQNIGLSIQDATHSQTTDNLALTQQHQLVIQGALHGHTAQNLSLTQQHQLAIQNAIHAQPVDNVELSTENTLGVQSVTHAHTAQNLNLTQVHVLTVQGATHGHTAGNVALTQQHNIIVQNVTHAQTSDNLVLNQIPTLGVSPVTHIHTANNILLGPGLVVSNVIHVHTAQNLNLTQLHLLVMQGVQHSHLVDSVDVNDKAPPPGPDNKGKGKGRFRNLLGTIRIRVVARHFSRGWKG